MATIKEIKELALHCVKGTVPANFSQENVNDAFIGEISQLATSINQFMKNRYDIYEIIVTAADEVVPNRVMDALGVFAEVKVVPQGQKVLFKKKLGRTRAKKFLTQVGLSGVYETFRLDNTTFEVPVQAIGGAVTIDFERMLDGAESLSECMDIMVEAQSDAVYGEVQKALKAAINAAGRPTNNMVSGNWDPDDMMKLISTVRAYAASAVIFAPPEFIAAMGPDAIVPVGSNYQGVYHPQDIDAIHNQGYINIFRGTPIVQIPQSYTDETNTTTVIDPQFAYVLPAGGERVVKVAMEGQTQIHDFVNRDNSMEIHTYRKIGVAILAHHNWGIYQNTSL